MPHIGLLLQNELEVKRYIFYFLGLEHCTQTNQIHALQDKCNRNDLTAGKDPATSHTIIELPVHSLMVANIYLSCLKKQHSREPLIDH